MTFYLVAASAFSFVFVSAADPNAVQILLPACDDDVFECPDATVVGRDATTNCNFLPCRSAGQRRLQKRTQQSMSRHDWTIKSPENRRNPYNSCDFHECCSQDKGYCPDGTLVVRNPANNCRFFMCPSFTRRTDADDAIQQYSASGPLQNTPPQNPAKGDKASLCMGPPWNYDLSNMFKSCGQGWGFVSRDPYQNCAFKACCAKDYKTCPNGIVVIRDSDNGCDFMTCPDVGRRIEAIEKRRTGSVQPAVGNKCGDGTHTCPDGTKVFADPDNKCRWHKCPDPSGPLAPSKCKTDRILGFKDGPHMGFKPACTKQGEYEAMQCNFGSDNWNENGCWCVDDVGKECIYSWMSDWYMRHYNTRPFCRTRSGKPVCYRRRADEGETTPAPASDATTTTSAAPESSEDPAEPTMPGIEITPMIEEAQKFGKDLETAIENELKSAADLSEDAKTKLQQVLDQLKKVTAEELKQVFAGSKSYDELVHVPESIESTFDKIAEDVASKLGYGDATTTEAPATTAPTTPAPKRRADDATTTTPAPAAPLEHLPSAADLGKFRDTVVAGLESAKKAGGDALSGLQSVIDELKGLTTEDFTKIANGEESIDAKVHIDSNLESAVGKVVEEAMEKVFAPNDSDSSTTTTDAPATTTTTSSKPADN